MESKTWSVYIIQCSDSKLYTGIASNVKRRVEEHNKGYGCRFTKYRCPVVLAYQEICGSKSAARYRELEIKKLRKEEKLELIAIGKQ